MFHGLPDLPRQAFLSHCIVSMPYVVEVANFGAKKALGPCYICRNKDTNLPCFTWNRPEPISLEEARALKAAADISCGGTLQIVRVKD